MPTISQLPSATAVSAEDEIALSQDGVVRSVSVGELLASTQPPILAPTGSLLGRVSAGVGGPEVVSVGTGLDVAASTLSANGADHALFPTKTALQDTDQIVLSSAGQPQLLEVSLLRGLFSGSANVAINSAGTISFEGSELVGPIGPQGPAGPVGNRGASVVSGSGAPDASLGSVGDAYLDASVGDVYTRLEDGWSKIGNIAGPQGASGPQGPAGNPGPQGIPGGRGPAGPIGPTGPSGPTGPQGLSGPPGTAFRGGNGAPNAAAGSIGDSYLDANSGDVFLKQIGGWLRTGNISGPPGKAGAGGPAGPAGATGPAGKQGPQGSQGPTGATGPAGKQGPMGVQGPSGALGLTGPAGSAGTRWPLRCTGAPGPAGASLLSGATAPSAAAGNVGDTYVNVVTGDAFVKSTSGWTKAGNLAGPQGSAGPAGSAGLAGSNLLSGSSAPSTNLGNVGDSFINVATGDFFAKSASGWNRTGNIMGPQGPAGAQGPVGSTGPQGPAGVQGPVGPTGPQGPAGSSTSITNAPVVTMIGSSDLVGISQGGADHSIAYSNLINGHLITDATNTSASVMSDTDQFWLGQGGSSNMVVGLLSQVATYMQGKRSSWPRRRVEVTATSWNLTFAAHQSAMVSCPNGGAITVNQFSDCGDGFECEVINTSSSSLTLGSGITCFGTTVLSPGQAVWIRGVTSAGVSKVYAQTPATLSTSPAINIFAIANQLASTSFIVSGTLNAYAAPPTLSYSNDGGNTWNPLPSASSVSSSAFSFSNPGIGAGTGLTVRLQDQNGVIGVSNQFNAEQASFGTLPSFVAGQSATVAFTMAGMATAYLVWWSTSASQEVGSRVAATASPVSITAPAAGSSYTLRIMDAVAGGLKVAESGPISVAPWGSESLTVMTPANSPLTAAITVNGTYANGTPVSLDWSINGGNTWSAALNPQIAGGNLAFSIPAGSISAGGPYILTIRDYNNTTVSATASGSFNVETAVATNVPTSGVQGSPIAGISATLTGLSVGYAILSLAGTDEGNRHAFTGSAVPLLVPQQSGSYTLRIYDAQSSGNKVYESSAISIAAAPAGSLPAIGIPNVITWLDVSNSQAVFADVARTSPQTVNNGLVQGLADLSANGYHVAQSSSSLAPTLVLARRNGLPGLRFVGSSQQFLQNLGGATWMQAYMATGLTVLAVFEVVSDAPAGTPYVPVSLAYSGQSSGQNAANVEVSTTNSPWVGFARNPPTSFGSAKDSNSTVTQKNLLLKVVGRFDGSSNVWSTVNTDATVNKSGVTGPFTGGGLWDTFRLGGQPVTGGPYVFDGYLYEVAIWATGSTDFSSALISYATNKWGS